MKEPFAKTGKVISDIRILKSKVVLYFTDDTKIDISKDCYTEFKLFINKEINQKEYNEIINFNNAHKLLEYALTLVGKGSYSEKAVIEKLKKKNANEKDIEFVISYLKRYGLINDLEYAKNFVEHALLMNKGKYRIKQELHDKGVDVDIINSVINYIEFDEELSHAKVVVVKLNKQYQNEPYLKKKEKINNVLLRKGYSYEIIKKCDYLIINNRESSKEFAKLKGEANKLIDKYGNSYIEINKHVIPALRRKGYSVKQIKEVLGGLNNDLY